MSNKYIGIQTGSTVFGSLLTFFISFAVYFLLLWDKWWNFILRFNNFTVPFGAGSR